jgi:hypothetical protein
LGREITGRALTPGQRRVELYENRKESLDMIGKTVAVRSSPTKKVSHPLLAIEKES